MVKNSTDHGNQNKTTEPNRKDYKRTNLELAFLKLLYREPLYESVDKNVRDINVLVIGWNDVSEAFIDQCLSVGQMLKHYINIVVMTANSDSSRDIDKYKAERPAMADFINIYNLQKEEIPSADNDPGQDSSKEMYGDLYLMTYPEGADAETLLSSFPHKNKEYNYIVVARRDETDNKKIADNLVSELGKSKKKDCKVCYVVHEIDSAYRKGRKAIPVYVPQEPATNRIDRDLVDKELDRMAFNSHILWGSFTNMDYQKAHRTFRNPKKDSDNSEDIYFYSSSVAMAASIRYKLADIGIEWGDFKSMAAKFEEKVTNNEQLLNELIALEHRRWLIDMAANGWAAPKESISDFCDDCCERKKINDYKNKIHPCMVRCSDTPSVSSETEYGNDRQKWDEVREGCTDEEKERFDDLDQMSLSLHRAMHKKAVAYRNSKPLTEAGPAASLEAYYKQKENDPKKQKENDPKLREHKRNGNRYLFCVKNVLDGNTAYSEQYSLYRHRFIESLHEVDDPQVKKELTDWVEEIDSDIWPALQSNRYIDYKNNDRKLIRGISFILTYSTKWTLALPIHIQGKIQKNYAGKIRPLLNVASAVLIRPARIIYLSYITHDEIDDLKETVKNCEDLFRDKNINCPIQVYVALSDSDPEAKITQKKDSTAYNTGNISYEFKECLSYTNAENYFQKCLQNCLSERKTDILYDETTSPFATINTAEEFNHKLTYIKRIHSFEFDTENKSFECCDETSACLNYIEKDAYFNVEELFNLSGLKEMEFDYPYLEKPEDRIPLWDIFTGKAYRTMKGKNPEARETDLDDGINYWHILTQTLNSCMKSYQHITVEGFRRQLESDSQFKKIHRSDEKKAGEVERTLEWYLKELIDEKFLVEDKNDFCWNTLKRCLAEDSKRYGSMIVSESEFQRRLELDPYIKKLDKDEAEEVKKKAGKYFSELSIKKDKDNKNEESTVENKNYKCYVYSDPSISTLFKRSGALLEYYLYYMIKEEGWADDIRNGAQMGLPGENLVYNELDLVITKGFKSVIVECKDTNDLNQNFYFKEYALADRIDPGINKVIVKYGKVPIIYRIRGNQFDIRTLAITGDGEKTNKDDKRDIREVADEIRKILE